MRSNDVATRLPSHRFHSTAQRHFEFHYGSLVCLLADTGQLFIADYDHSLGRWSLSEQPAPREGLPFEALFVIHKEGGGAEEEVQISSLAYVSRGQSDLRELYPFWYCKCSVCMISLSLSVFPF